MASIEAWATGLAKECYKTRKELEQVSAPAPRKGLKHLSVNAIQKRTKHLITKRPAFNNG